VAQERPNFTGTWLMDMARSESSAQQSDSSPRKPITVVVVQRPTDLTIETRTDDKNQALTYKLTSTTADQETAPIGTVGSADSVQSAIMRWDGPRLVTVTVYRLNGMAVNRTEIRTLAPNGREMFVETHLQVQHGYESDGRGPQGYTSAKDVYVRTDR
jgi:hypothetical protein